MDLNPAKHSGKTVDLVCGAWLVLVTAAVASGWVTSIVGVTHWAGYLTLGVALAFGFYWRAGLLEAAKHEWQQIRSREGLFLVLFLLLGVVALTQTPGVHDSLAYRIPRIRWWLQEGGLAWFEGWDQRINVLGRNWEWCGLSILSVVPSERFLTLPALGGWFVMWRCFSSWGERFGLGPLAKWAVVIFLTSPLIGGQASTTINDLFAASLVVVSVHFFLRSEDERLSAPRAGAIFLVLSGLALSVASGAKPNLSVALPFWCAVALLRWGRNPGVLPWKHLIWMVPLAALCSSIPTLVLNFAETGELSGLDVDSDWSVSPKNPFLAVPLGHLMFWWQSVQPSFNPVAGMMNSYLEPLTASWSTDVPRLDLTASPARFDGGAYWGTFATLVIALGTVMGLRAVTKREKPVDAAPAMLLWGLGVLGISLNFFFAVPSTLGRSSGPFMIFFLPLVFLGMACLSSCKWAGRGMLVLALGSLASFALVLVLRPSRPALGVEVAARATKVLSGPKAEEAVRAYRERVFAGRELYAAVPDGESEVGLILSTNACLAEAWRSLPAGTRVAFFLPEEIAEMNESEANYFVASPPKLETAERTYPELLDHPGFEVRERRLYRQLTRVPKQSWYLLRKVCLLYTSPSPRDLNPNLV